ncbi:hypothetical protein LOTGIDRAFT_236387 [Lottia gigantea]|uniref:Inositol 1,4,5-trisphosphate receptor n=1 Tax=Lottia gigantea TaxID=225164 RepID=V3ZN73_LOTGI|nr:hypothetical protein LOTGIDRAFT_236387 [Lottia gigantea]ESO83880.1 hypothetical protein LOTGIDRAFT_236387 [Lottia gigantea]
MDDTLCVGDVVCLYSEEANGFALSKQSSSVHSEIAVASRQDRVRPYIPDQQDYFKTFIKLNCSILVISFQICVANRYKLNKRYRKLQAQSYDRPDDIALKNSVAQAKITADSESEDNDSEQKRQLGRKVLYGQVIQLRHLFTGKYIHVSTTKTSITESNNMAVELRSDNAKHCQFRIMPRYKVKSEGDVVQVDDQIVLESFKSAGQFLHVSRAPLPKTSVYSQSFEMNLSVLQSGFTVYRKYKPEPDDKSKVKVSDILRFYHKEMEAYLVAEGLFDDEIVEDVHLRVRQADQSNPKTLFPSSSAVTYWQIELQEGSVAGGILKWEQQCKIIHMCTRKYLTVDESGKVTMTTDHLDPRTVFRLHAVIRDNDDISFESYCRIEHVVSGHWLHAFSIDHKSSQAASGDDKNDSMSGLKYSTAQLKKIGAIKEKQYDDAFTVQAVDGELCQIFNYMAGMVPCIQKLVTDKKNNMVLNAKSTHEIITALKEMAEFMIENSVPSKNRQKLMRNLRIVDLLANLLQIPCRGSPDQMHLTKIFVEAYSVLYSYLMGNSRKNELYIAKYIDFFLTQFEYKEGKIGLNAAHMVMELIRDNRKIVDRITHDHINQFVERLHREKNYRYLDLLSVLCVCDGVSIADNQKYITEAWLMKGNKSLDHVNMSAVGFVNCVYLTDLGEKIGKEPGTVYVSTNNGRLWKELHQFAIKSHTEAESNETYLFLEHQLELFRMLCHGQNEFSISVITKELDYLTWNEAFTCLSDNRLPDRLRAKYCDLITTLFVDIGSNISVIDRVKLSYNYDLISKAEAQVDMSSSPTYQYFPQIRDWITKFLASNGDMTASEIGNNMFVKQVLRLVYYLVVYGFYYQTEDIRELLAPLMSLLDGRNDKPYPNVSGTKNSEVLKYFNQVARYQKSPETKAIVDAKLQALEVMDLFFNFIFNLRMERLMLSFKTTNDQASKPNMTPELGVLLFETFELETHSGGAKSACKVLQNIFEETEFFKNYEITEILLDLSHYDYDEMLCKSMHILNRYYSFHQNLFNKAIQAQVLITDNSVNIMSRLSQILPVLRRLATAKLNDDQVLQLADILDELILMCQLEGEADERHFMNQKILYNHGVLEDALTILSQAIDIKLLDQYGGLKKIFQKTFVLLQSMAQNNKIVQGRLFDRLELLLYKEGAPSQLADLLTEIFTGNSTTCMKIQSHHVMKIVTLIAKHKSKVPQFLNLLNAVVKVEELDLPLKRNQSFVMTYFMQYRSEIAYIIDQPEDEREKILTSDSDELNYLISMVDLLATCAGGENQFIESICQTIFKIGDLLKVLNHPSVHDNLKKPFLRFLLWVYMNTASGMIESGAGDLPHDKNMWDFLKSTSEKLKKVKLFVENNKEETKQLLKRPPSKSDKSTLEKENMRGTLHYIFDGVMQFLQIFCRSYYQPDSMFPNEKKELSQLALDYEAFLEVIAPLVCDETQLKNLLGAMTGLITATNAISKSKMEEFHNTYGHLSGSDIHSDSRKKYEEYYAAEEEINVNLNVFVVNMELSYGGVNTVENQIGYPSDQEYSEKGEDEDLPLGQEFQNHLKCFVDSHTKDPTKRYRLAEKLVRQLLISSNLTNLSEKERLDQTQLDIKCLKLLRGLIHNEIVKLPFDWEADIQSHKKLLKTIESVQTAINSYGVVDSLCNHLSRPVDDIVRELLAFMCALLFSGNEDVQTSLYEYFTGTREETFFFAIKDRMQLSAVATREKRLLHAQHQAKVDDLIAQTRALQKAMKEGQTTNTAFLTSQLGSMLSVAKSRTSLRGSGNYRKSKLANGKSSLNGCKISLKKSTVQLPNGFKQKNGSVIMNNNKNNKVLAKNKASVVPTTDEDVDIKIDQLYEEEIAELTNYFVFIYMQLDKEELTNYFVFMYILEQLDEEEIAELTNYFNYLREQPDNIKSVNLVAETTKFLSILYSSVNNNTISLITALFDTLVEYTSGNFANQTVVFDYKICDYINHILRSEIYKGCDAEEVQTLKKSIAMLIRVLTEENPPSAVDDDNALSLVQEIFEYLDTDALSAVMVKAYNDILSVFNPSNNPSILNYVCPAGAARMELNDRTSRHNEQENQTHTDNYNLPNLTRKVGFAFHHILCRMIDLHGEETLSKICKNPEITEAWEYFSCNTLSIEIIKDDVLQKMHFQVKDKNVLREEIKDKFKYEVDRSSPSNKLRDFMDWSSDIIADIRYQRKIHSIPLARLLVKTWPVLNVSVLFLSVIIALMILITWKADGSTTSTVPDTSNYPFAFEATYILGGIHNLLTFLMIITYFLSNRPSIPTWVEIKNFFKRRGIGKKNKEENEEEIKTNHLQARLFSFLTFYYLVFLLFSILGTIFHGYFFAFHLLHMAMLNQLLKRVIQAVTRNGLSLILVGLLGLAIIYIYALAAFAFFRDVLDSNDGRQCNTMIECFITVIHHGLSDGMYNTLEGQLSGASFPRTIEVAVYDVTFFIIITTIGLNIIFGIIVDTFSELRDSKWQIDNDMKSNCFICSRENYDFERQALGFSHHVKKEHNQWAYLFFFIYLDETRPNDYSALELYVHKMRCNNSLDFFPLNRALSLQHEEDSSEKKIETLMSQVDYLVKKMKETQVEKEKDKEKQRQKEWEEKHRKSSKTSA